MLSSVAGLIRSEMEGRQRVQLTVTTNPALASLYNGKQPGPLGIWTGVGVYKCRDCFFVPRELCGPAGSRGNFQRVCDLLNSPEVCWSSVVTAFEPAIYLQQNRLPGIDLQDRSDKKTAMRTCESWLPVEAAWLKLLILWQETVASSRTNVPGSFEAKHWPCFVTAICDALLQLEEGGKTRKNAKPTRTKGVKTQFLIQQLAKHHDYHGGTISHCNPIRSVHLQRDLNIAASTISHFFSTQFPSKGKARDGYKQACRNQGELLFWFLRKFDAPIPSKFTSKMQDIERFQDNA